MNKRELKRALKAFAIRRVWLQPELRELFESINYIRTDRQKQRVEEVLLQIMKEWD